MPELREVTPGHWVACCLRRAGRDGRDGEIGRAGMSDDVLLRVEDLEVQFPVARQVVRWRREGGQGRRRRLVRGAPRRDPRPGRRVRLWQVDHRSRAAASARTDRRGRALRRHRRPGRRQGRTSRTPPADGDDLPGPLRLAESADERQLDRRRGPRDPRVAPRPPAATRDASASCSSSSDSTRSTGPGIRTSSQVASASGSGSRVRWRPNPI